MHTLKYLAKADSLNDIEAIRGKLSADDALLVGEYGSLLPLAFFAELRKLPCEKILYEMTARNKNRDVVRSSIITAYTLGFDGVVIASGQFRKGDNMARPVYDLDPAQMLNMMMHLQMDRVMSTSFLIGVRAPVGSEAAKARARYYLENGADLLVIGKNDAPAGTTKKTVILEEL